MKKNIYMLLGVLAVLIGVAYVLMNRPGESDISIGSSQFLVDVDSIAVDKIEITSPTNTVVRWKKRERSGFSVSRLNIVPINRV